MLTRGVVLPRGCPGQGRIRTAHNEGQGGAGGIQVQPEGAGAGAQGAWAEAQAGQGGPVVPETGSKPGLRRKPGAGQGQGVRGLMAPESGWFPKSRAFRFHRGAGPAKGPGPGVSGIRGEMESGIKCAG